MKHYGFISQRGEIIKLDTLVGNTNLSNKKKNDESTQPKDQYERQRPYNMGTVDTLTDGCVYVSSAAEIIAKDIIGNGFEVLPVDKDKENAELQKRIIQWINDQDLMDTIYKGLVDYKIYGEFILEKADHTLYYMPVRYTSLMVDKDILKYWYNGQTVYFKRYKSGNKQPFNEFIRFTNHNREDRDYGRPAVIDISEAILSNILIREYNNAYFKNYGMPAGVILISGNYDEGNYDDDGVSDFEKSIKAQVQSFAQNPHSIMCFTAKSTDPNSKVDIELKPINGGMDDGAFSNLKEQNNDEIFAGLRVPKYLYGINEVGSLGGDNSEQAIETYKRHELQPIKTKIEKIVNELIVDLFNSDAYRFELKHLDTTDKNAELDYAIKVVEHGGMKLGDFCSAFGDEYGSKAEEMGDAANAFIYGSISQVLNPLESGLMDDNIYRDAILEEQAIANKARKKSKGLFDWFKGE